MNIEKETLTPELIKTYGLKNGQKVYRISQTEFGISGLLSQEELQQIYEFQSHQLDYEFVQESYPSITDRDLTDSEVERFAKAMRGLAGQKNIPDYEALEVVIEDAESSQSANGNTNQTEAIEGTIVKNAEGKYSANVRTNGETVAGIPNNVGYRTLKKTIKEQWNIELPFLKELNFKREGQKYYANFQKGAGEK